MVMVSPTIDLRTVGAQTLNSDVDTPTSELQRADLQVMHTINYTVHVQYNAVNALLPTDNFDGPQKLCGPSGSGFT